MPDPVTPNKGYTIPATGADTNTWGPVLNGNFSALDSLQGGTYALAVSSGNYTITAANAQNARIQITGTVTGPVTLTIPQKPGCYFFHDQTSRIIVNGSGFYPITVTTGSTNGRTQNLPARLGNVFTDGQNCYLASEPNHGEVKQFAGFVPPLYLHCDGSTYARTTYPDLFDAMSFQTTGNVTSGSNQITSVVNPSSNAMLANGAYIEGAGIAVGTTITDVTGSGPWTFTISANATATTAGATLTIIPFGQGDGSTTFNVPDFRGRVPAGPDMGFASGALAGVLNGSSGVSVSQFGFKGGNQLLQSHNHGVTDPGHAHGVTDPGHNHTLNDPGHSHGVYDPGHNHGQSPHGHGISDPGHSHGVNDPGHNHAWTIQSLYPNRVTGGSNFGAYTGPGTNSYGTSNNGTGISIQGSGTGVSVNAGYANINAATTGVGIYASGTGTYNSASGTGVSVNSGHTGVTVNNNGSGASQNVPPMILMNFIIYAGQ